MPEESKDVKVAEPKQKIQVDLDSLWLSFTHSIDLL